MIRSSDQRPSPGLRQTQELFWTLITAPEGVRPALEDLARRGTLPSTAVDDLIVGDEQLSTTDRLDIYANMYFFRLLDALKEDYPVVLAAIGGDRFHNLVTDYLLRHPSMHPSLRYLGEHLPGFIATHALSREFPCLADVARLEWARVEVFDAPDAASLTRESLAGLPPDRAGEVRFTLVPAFDLLRLDHDVVRLWRGLKKRPSATPGGEEPGEANPRRVPRRPVVLRVWRNGFAVYHKGIDGDEARALELVRAGEPLGRICNQLSAGRTVAQGTERAGRLIQSWLEDGILATLALPD